MLNISKSAQSHLLEASIPNSLRFSSSVFVACLTSTASSITRFMNSSKPYAIFLSLFYPKVLRKLYTLILPSIRIASCSNSHIDTVERCCRSLKMKLIGGRRTFPLPPPPPPRPVIVLSGEFQDLETQERRKSEGRVFSGDNQSHTGFKGRQEFCLYATW